MTSIPEEHSPTASPRKGLTLLDLGMIMMIGAAIGGFYMSTYWTLSAHDKVRATIEEKVLARNDLETCSVLINTQRHEGKCGSFGEYTVLSGGRNLFVFKGGTDKPSFVGSTGWAGFRASEELQEFALSK